MASVRSALRDLIKINGPISVARFMQLALTLPKAGYYTKDNAIFGTKGDFITSPEISQMFGEMLALKVMTWASNLAASTPIRLVELGPGRGTLLSDMLRTLFQFEHLSTNLHFCNLIEISDALTMVQKSNLKKYPSRFQWSKTIDEFERKDSSQEAVVFIAHEYFDALPAYVFKRDLQSKWRELLVNLSEDDRFTFVTSADVTGPQRALQIDEVYRDLPQESLEVCPEAIRTANWMKNEMLKSKNALALIVDYGQLVKPTFSLRAIKDHKIMEDPLMEAGECDLSIDVDFEALRNVFKDHCETQIKYQGQFLLEMGIMERSKELIRRHAKDLQVSKQISQDYERLVDPKQMGKTYKVLVAQTK